MVVNDVIVIDGGEKRGGCGYVGGEGYVSRLSRNLVWINFDLTSKTVFCIYNGKKNERGEREVWNFLTK